MKFNRLSFNRLSKSKPGEYYFYRNGDWVLDTAAQLTGKKAQPQATRDGYLQTAVLRIASVQCGNEFGEASEAELATSLAWKCYAVNLSRVEHQPDYPFVIE